MGDRCLVPFSKPKCVLLVAVVLAVGCASDLPAAVSYDGADDDTEAEAMRPPQPLVEGEWQSLDFDARKRFMIDVVMPTMRALFVEADAERFAGFSCSSCHGSGAGDTFAMPSSDLPALGGPPASMDDERKQHVTEFMRNTVKPKMAELLAEPELRCSKCHPSAS